MSKYHSAGTLRVRQTALDVPNWDAIFVPDTDHAVTHKDEKYAVFISEGGRRAIVHTLKHPIILAVIDANAMLPLAQLAAVKGTNVAVKVEFEPEEAVEPEEADFNGRFRLVGITAPAT